METAVRPVRRRKIWIAAALIALLLLELAALGFFFGREAWNYVRRGVLPVYRGVDGDHDFIDDYRDMMLGARAYVRTQPEYVSDYFAGGYPPEGQGVCTDVIWRAFRAAGYDFKAMVDADIAENPSAYPLADGLPDRNIDFRRVVNLQVFFERNGVSLTLDANEIDQWQTGDIVFYHGHVAMISDRRNENGAPFIIHHTSRGAFEEDALTYQKIIGHYRWTAEK